MAPRHCPGRTHQTNSLGFPTVFPWCPLAFPWCSPSVSLICPWLWISLGFSLGVVFCFPQDTPRSSPGVPLIVPWVFPGLPVFFSGFPLVSPWFSLRFPSFPHGFPLVSPWFPVFSLPVCLGCLQVLPRVMRAKEKNLFSGCRLFHGGFVQVLLGDVSFVADPYGTSWAKPLALDLV